MDGKDMKGCAQIFRKKWEARCVLMGWLAGGARRSPLKAWALCSNQQAAASAKQHMDAHMERYAHLAARERQEPAYPCDDSSFGGTPWFLGPSTHGVVGDQGGRGEGSLSLGN